MTKYNQVVEQVTNNLDKYEWVRRLKPFMSLSGASFAIGIELVKLRLYGKEIQKQVYSSYVLNYTTNTLNLHPFMPL